MLNIRQPGFRSQPLQRGLQSCSFGSEGIQSLRSSRQFGSCCVSPNLQQLPCGSYLKGSIGYRKIANIPNMQIYGLTTMSRLQQRRHQSRSHIGFLRYSTSKWCSYCPYYYSMDKQISNENSIEFDGSLELQIFTSSLRQQSGLVLCLHIVNTKTRQMCIK